MLSSNDELIFAKKVENTISNEEIEKSPEYLTVDFESYEKICNYSNDGSRRRGILSSEMYEEIIEDSTTRFINFGNNRIPALMDVKYGLSMGYDEARCREYSEQLSNDARILTIPIHELNDFEKEQLVVLLSENKIALYFGDHNENESKALSDLLEKSGLLYLEKPLLDSRILKGNQQASLSLYSSRVELSPDPDKRKIVSNSDLYSYYLEYMLPLESPDKKTFTRLDLGNMIRDETAEEYWDLYNDRFDFLGENHPISMQDSKEDFLDLLRSKDTVISSTFVKDEENNNQLACFSYYVDNIDNLYWLNQDYLREKFSTSNNDKNVTVTFTPGVVSSGVGKSYSLLSMALYTKACDNAGVSTNLIFENTNFSKNYIPTFVDRVMKRSCENIKVAHPSKLEDEVEYKLWQISSES